MEYAKKIVYRENREQNIKFYSSVCNHVIESETFMQTVEKGSNFSYVLFEIH